MKRPSKANADPFFALPKDSDWNACIGRQADEQDYVDGYAEAAVVLASSVIDGEMYGSRDTLVMPTLYCARHAVELSLKFVATRLCDAGVIPKRPNKNHNIRSLFSELRRFASCDEAFRQSLDRLSPYVTSLTQIDDDGQELRYSKNRKGQQSLADHALANLEVIRDSAGEMRTVLGSLKRRTIEISRERQAGTFTRLCSRRDLFSIAKMLPIRSEWTSPAFSEAKTAACARFHLSNTQFSKAVSVIEATRETRSLIGLQTQLAYLSDASAAHLMCLWSELQTVIREKSARPSTSGIELEEVSRFLNEAAKVTRLILEALSKEEIADMRTIFYLGRDDVYCEYYESLVKREIADQNREGANLAEGVRHVIVKMNFGDAFIAGVSKLGRPDLVEDLQSAASDFI